jgi:NAD(P) transhydrogenase subunit alpha
MWSRNMEKLLFHLTKDGTLKIDDKDEITTGCLITKDGEVVQPRVREALGLPAKAAPAAPPPKAEGKAASAGGAS